MSTQPTDANRESGETCPAHGKPWVTPDAPDGRRRCTFYIPEFGASEDYGCPQDPGEELLWRIFGEAPLDCS